MRTEEEQVKYNNDALREKCLRYISEFLLCVGCVARK